MPSRGIVESFGQPCRPTTGQPAGHSTNCVVDAVLWRAHRWRDGFAAMQVGIRRTLAAGASTFIASSRRQCSRQRGDEPMEQAARVIAFSTLVKSSTASRNRSSIGRCPMNRCPVRVLDLTQAIGAIPDTGPSRPGDVGQATMSAQYAIQPPSTSRFVPLTNEHSSEARKSAAAATSSGATEARERRARVRVGEHLGRVGLVGRPGQDLAGRDRVHDHARADRSRPRPGG